MINFFSKSDDMRCTLCSKEWNDVSAHAAGLHGCPYCKTMVQAQKISEDGYIKVNWQDLRMLSIFATRWSKLFDMRFQVNIDALAALQNIISKLEKYQPKGGGVLVPADDIEVIRRAVPNTDGEVEIEVHHKQPSVVPDGIPSPYFIKL